MADQGVEGGKGKETSNPWSADASDGATKQTYEIRTLMDFFKVPEERRRICLREFHAWMAIQEGVTALICAVAEGQKADLKASDLKWTNDVFRWIDDGKGCITVRMMEPEKQP